MPAESGFELQIRMFESYKEEKEMETNNKLVLIDQSLNLDHIFRVYKDKPWYDRNKLTIFSGPGYLRLKRVIDLVFSIFLVILILPVLVICAIAIKIDSAGPIVFVQKRTGLGGGGAPEPVPRRGRSAPCAPTLAPE